MADLPEGIYFAESAQAETDLNLRLLNFTAQRGCYCGMEKPIFGLYADNVAPLRPTLGLVTSQSGGVSASVPVGRAELQERARKEGGNAVVNTTSNYRNEVSESATKYAYGAGAVNAGVALKGDVVRLKK